MPFAIFKVETVHFFPNPASPTSIQVTGPAIFGTCTQLTVNRTTNPLTNGTVVNGAPSGFIDASSTDSAQVFSQILLVLGGNKVQLSLTFNDLPGSHHISAVSCSVQPLGLHAISVTALNDVLASEEPMREPIQSDVSELGGEGEGDKRKKKVG